MERNYPVNKDGFIDEAEVFKLAYSTLKLPLGTLDDLAPYELLWLLESHFAIEREWFEILSHTIKTSIYSANTGKQVKLFSDPNEMKSENKSGKPKGRTTKEQKEADLSALKEKFE